MIGSDFITAGRAIFTIENDKGTHKTYRVKRSRPSERFPNPAYFIDVLSGTDNENSYAPIGRVIPETGVITLTSISRFSPNDLNFKIAKFALEIAYRSRPLPIGYRLRHSGKCGRCGRTLTHPDSLTNGIGPECIKHTLARVAMANLVPARTAELEANRRMMSDFHRSEGVED